MFLAVAHYRSAADVAPDPTHSLASAVSAAPRSAGYVLLRPEASSKLVRPSPAPVSDRARADDRLSHRPRRRARRPPKADAYFPVRRLSRWRGARKVAPRLHSRLALRDADAKPRRPSCQKGCGGMSSRGRSQYPLKPVCGIARKTKDAYNFRMLACRPGGLQRALLVDEPSDNVAFSL